MQPTPKDGATDGHVGFLYVFNRFLLNTLKNIETMNIRKFSDRDIDQILALQDEWFESDILPSYVNRLYKELFTENNTLVLEFKDIIGYSVFEKRDIHEYEIEYLYLSNAERGKGFGEKIMNSVEKEIKKQGGRKIILSPATEIDQDKLINYYMTLGYSQEEDRISGGVSHKIMSKEI